MRSQGEMPVRAAIYARISHDREGAGLGVERQEADCRALAERLGWEVTTVYVDNDISAYSGRVRPEYRAMLNAIKVGHVNGVLAWHTDRLHRRTVELEEFVTLAEEHHTKVQTVTAGPVDLSTASGRMVARMLGAAAQHEVDHARERMKRAKEQAAREGRYRGGVRPYGYEADGVTVRESEAEVVREAAKLVLAGRSLRSVASEMTEAGLRTSTGNEWTRTRLKEVLLRPRNAGLLASGRRLDIEIVGKAVWPAILEEETWRSLFTMLMDPSRNTSKTNETRWLGSGLYLCGKCGATLRPAPYGGTKKRKHARRYLYRCTESAHLSINADDTDNHVREQVATLVRDPRVIAAMGPDEGGLSQDRERRLVLTRRLAQFEEDYFRGQITGQQLKRATDAVNEELQQVDARLAAGVRQTASAVVLNAIDPGEAFLAAPLDVQRAVLAAVLTVTVMPAKGRGMGWTADRLHIERPSVNA